MLLKELISQGWHPLNRNCLPSVLTMLGIVWAREYSKVLLTQFRTAESENEWRQPADRWRSEYIMRHRARG
jgi:hypothetical protein